MRTALFTSALILALGCAPPPRERVDLDVAERKQYSQFGEEGVIEKIFEIIPKTSSKRFAVEFGAHNGINAANTRLLITEQDWDALLIEGNPRLARELARNYAGDPGVTTMQAWIFPGNIEYLFEKGGVPKDFDFLVIDIDSNDYWVWKALHEYRPKVVMIEANHQFMPPQRAVVNFHPMNYWDGTTYSGASLQSLYDLGKRKGYELVHMMRLGPNVFFVDEKYFDLFGIDDNSPVKMNRNRHRGVKPWPHKKRTLKIDAFEIEKKWIPLPLATPNEES